MTALPVLQIKVPYQKRISDFQLRQPGKAALSLTAPLTYLTGSSKPSRNWRRLLHCRDGFNSVTGAMYFPCTLDHPHKRKYLITCFMSPEALK
jgi:hypothetical protein